MSNRELDEIKFVPNRRCDLANADNAVRQHPA